MTYKVVFLGRYCLTFNLLSLKVWRLHPSSHPADLRWQSGQREDHHGRVRRLSPVCTGHGHLQHPSLDLLQEENESIILSMDLKAAFALPSLNPSLGGTYFKTSHPAQLHSKSQDQKWQKAFIAKQKLSQMLRAIFCTKPTFHGCDKAPGLKDIPQEHR